MESDIRKNTIAMVTGGNSGIGFATAKLLVDMSCDVFIVGRNADAIKMAAKTLCCHAIVADLSDPSSIEEISKPFLETGLDFLVNNAGISYLTPIESISLMTINEHFSTNVFTPLLLIKSLLPALSARKGSITNVSSIITLRNVAGFSIYSATKGALESITKCLAIELAPHNIRVNAVCPGAINTPMFRKSRIPDELIPQIENHLMTTIPLRRRGEPGEVAAAIYAQLENSYVTGSVWNVDGGVGA